MEPNQQNIPVEQVPHTPNQHSHLLPTFIVGVLMLFLGLTGGYLLFANKSEIIQTDVYQRSQTASPTNILTPTITPTSNSLKTYESTQIPGNLLKPYTIQFPKSWIDKNERLAGLSDTLTLTKDNYVITIHQTAGGGGGCIFEGEVPNGPYGDYRNKKYTEISSGVGILRRFENTPPTQKDSVRFDFCAKSGNMFQDPSEIGSITYTAPVNYTQAILKDMDTIVSSLNVAP